MPRKKAGFDGGDFRLPSTTSVNLESSPAQMQFYQAVESLAPGESCLYYPGCSGITSRKRCLGMKAWITWERKRRIRSMMIAGILDSIDPLAGTSIYLIKDENLNYTLKVEKFDEEEIVVNRKDGSVQSSR